MISKEKFNELKSEKKKIYYLDYGLLGSCSVKELDFSKRQICGVCADYFPIPDEELEVHDYCNIENDDGCNEYFVCYLKDCYETQDDAEFAKEFKNITRIETLNLPTWEVFTQLGIPFEFTSKDGKWFCLEICDIAGIDKIVVYHKIGFISNIFSAPATKENYLEACKIAKKLFLGDK